MNEQERDAARSVSRTFRAAIRLGEDFITLEETITLPITASDSEVQQAVDLGWRIYTAQRESLEQQIAAIRENQPAPAPITVREPDAPASDKQRHYIAALQDSLLWTSERLGTYAQEQGIDLVTMTRGQASNFIDGLKRIADERARYQAQAQATPAAAPPPPPSEPPAYQPAHEKQIQALQRLAAMRDLDFEAEVVRRFQIDPADLSFEQAKELLLEWQPRQRRERPA